MKIFDDIKLHLPVYLSQESTEELFADLKDFPNNFNKLYTSISEEGYVVQGDGIRNMPIINLPITRIENSPVMLLSNTCDIEPSNKRFTSSRLIYCPIIKLSNYVKYLKAKSINEERVTQFINSIRKQEISTIFYLPIGARLDEECVVFLDNINNCDVSVLPVDKVEDYHLFSLSNYGFYVFLVKLSIHFTRIREGIDRRFIIPNDKI